MEGGILKHEQLYNDRDAGAETLATSGTLKAGRITVTEGSTAAKEISGMSGDATQVHQQ
jgi:hypothetical protein